MSGLFLIDRNMLNHYLVGIKNPKKFAAWCWILSQARWKPCKVHVNNMTINLERGQFAASRKFVAKETGLTEKEVRTLFLGLEREKMVTKTVQAKGRGVSVITICNYDKYQDIKNYGANQKAKQGPSKGQARANDRTPEETPEETPDKDIRPQNLQIFEADKKINSPESECLKIFQDTAKRCGLPVPSRLSESRRSKLKARLSEAGGVEGWRIACQKLEESDFCTGKKTNWRADLDFVLQQKSFTKLMEGSYDNQHGPNFNESNFNGRRSDPHYDQLAGFASYAARKSGPS